MRLSEVDADGNGQIDAWMPLVDRMFGWETGSHQLPGTSRLWFPNVVASPKVAGSEEASESSGSLADVIKPTEVFQNPVGYP